jgi:hypothetical protein
LEGEQPACPEQFILANMKLNKGAHRRNCAAQTCATRERCYRPNMTRWETLVWVLTIMVLAYIAWELAWLWEYAQRMTGR